MSSLQSAWMQHWFGFLQDTLLTNYLEAVNIVINGPSVCILLHILTSIFAKVHMATLGALSVPPHPVRVWASEWLHSSPTDIMVQKDSGS